MNFKMLLKKFQYSYKSGYSLITILCESQYFQVHTNVPYLRKNYLAFYSQNMIPNLNSKICQLKTHSTFCLVKNDPKIGKSLVFSRDLDPIFYTAPAATKILFLISKVVRSEPKIIIMLHLPMFNLSKSLKY